MKKPTVEKLADRAAKRLGLDPQSREGALVAYGYRRGYRSAQRKTERDGWTLKPIRRTPAIRVPTLEA